MKILIIAASLIVMICSAKADCSLGSNCPASVSTLQTAPRPQPGQVFCQPNGGIPIWIMPGQTCPPSDHMSIGGVSCQQHGDEIWCGGFPFGSGGATIQGDTYGCLPGEERVMRSDFSVGCAKDVHPQTWH